MKRIYLKRALSLSLAAVMAVTMVGCGCGKKKQEAGSEEQASHDAADYVFKDNPIDLGANVDTSSLSAILLNDDYYNFMMKGRKIVNDIPVLNAEYLIPFKMYAWLDLTSRKEKDEFVKENDHACQESK